MANTRFIIGNKMKKIIKIFLISIGVLLIIILALLYYSISVIDTAPYFETTYYTNTIEKIDSSINNKIILEGNLLAGFAKINITPKIVEGDQNPSYGEFNSIKLSGFGDGKYATGVHDSIFAKAVAIKVGDNLQILLSADLLLMPPKVVKKVEENLKNQSEIQRNQILFGATHTHASIGNCIPGYVGAEFGGEYQPEVVEWLSTKLTTLIFNSIIDLQSSKLSSGYVHVPELISNRIIGETGRLNDRFTIVSIIQENGKKCVIGIFGAHATVLGPWNDQFSGDYPGYFQNSLQNKGIDFAMFFAGTVGSHTNRGIGSKFDRSKYIGETLADSALAVLQDMEYTSKVRYSFISTEIEIPKLQVIYLAERLRLSPEIGHRLFPNFNSTYIQSFAINNLLWISMPCELSGEYAIDLQNALELKGFYSAITSFNGQYLGYVVPAKYYNYDHYESRLMGWFGPSMGDYIMELNYKLASNLIGSKL